MNTSSEDEIEQIRSSLLEKLQKWSADHQLTMEELEKAFLDDAVAEDKKLSELEINIIVFDLRANPVGQSTEPSSSCEYLTLLPEDATVPAFRSILKKKKQGQQTSMPEDATVPATRSMLKKKKLDQQTETGTVHSADNIQPETQAPKLAKTKEMREASRQILEAKLKNKLSQRDLNSGRQKVTRGTNDDGPEIELVKRHPVLEKPVISWEWSPHNPEEAESLHGNGLLIVTAKSNGHVTLQVGNEDPVDGENEVTVRMLGYFGDSYLVLARVETPGQDSITVEETIVIPMNRNMAPDTNQDKQENITNQTIKDMSEEFEDMIEGRNESFDAPSIKWEWNPGEVTSRGEKFDGVLIVTATGDAQGRGLIAIDGHGPDGEIPQRRGEDEAILNIPCHYGDKFTANAYVFVCGDAASPINTESYTVPAKETPKPKPDPQPQPKPNPPVIKHATSGSNLFIYAEGEGLVTVKAGSEHNCNKDKAAITLNFNPEDGIVIDAYAVIVDANGKSLSDESKVTIRIKAERPSTPKPEPQPQNPCDHNEEHNGDFEALLNKIKLWYSKNNNKPLTTEDLEKRFSKKFKSPNQRITIEELELLKGYLPNHPEFTNLLAPSVTVQTLQALIDKSTGQRIPSSSLILIVGISKVQQARLKAQGIVDVATLLNRGRTPETRKALAAKLDLDVRMVNSWVKQADLWRVEGMTIDLAYLLVLAGVRNIDDLARIDIKKISPILKGLCSVQTDFSYTEADKTRLETIIVKANELVKFQSATTSVSEVNVQISKILDELKNENINTKDLSQVLQTRLKRAIAKTGSQDLGILITYDEDPPFHLFKDGGFEMSAAELELLNGKNIKRGLDFLDDIQFTLPLPHRIQGRVVHRSKDSKAQPTPMADVEIEISGIVSPSDDKKEASENPSGMTDGDGRFIIVLPDKYSMKESITITVKDGSYKQRFVRSASDIIAGVEAQSVLNMFYELDSLGDEVDYLMAQCNTLTTKLEALASEKRALESIKGGPKEPGVCTPGPESASIDSAPGPQKTTPATKDLIKLPSKRIIINRATEDDEITKRIAEIEHYIEKYTQLLEGTTDEGIDSPGYKPGYRNEKDRKMAEYAALQNKLFDRLAQTGNRPRDAKEAFDLFLNNTHDLSSNIKGEGDAGALVVIDEVFKSQLDDRETALPRVKLMDNDEEAVRLSTDTAPSRIYKYSMLQRLVEPNISKGARESLVNPVDVMDFRKKMSTNPDLYQQASSLGMGYILNMHQAWVPNGFALGELLYSLILAPGEEQRLIVRENKQAYTILDKAEGADTVSEDYLLSQDDDTTAAFNYAVNQFSAGKSQYNYSAKTGSGGGSFGFGAIGEGLSALFGLSGGYSKSSGSGSSSAQQNNSHNEASSTAQSFQHSIKSASNRIAQAKRISMEMASSETKQSVATKIIANHNHSHAMTIQYWEVMRRYKLETCIDDVNLVLFVPMKLLKFLPDQQDLYLTDFLKTKTFEPSVFNNRYDTLLRYYDTLYYNMPYKYRSGMTLIKRFAAYPNWVMENIHVNEGNKKVTLTLKGNFMEFDSFRATIHLTNGKGNIAGHCSVKRLASIQKMIEDKKIQTQKDLLQMIDDYRSTHSDIPLEITFTLPSNVSMTDLVSISINHSIQPFNYTLFLGTFISKDQNADLNQWSKAQADAVQRYVQKETDLYKDDTKSEHDIKQMQHYYQGLPENFIVNYIKNGATLSASQLSNAGDVEIDNYDLKFNGSAMTNSSISSFNLNYALTINITHSLPIMRYNELMLMEEALHHIVSNPIRYSQAVWASLSDDERVMILEKYTIDMNFDIIDDVKDPSERNEDLIPLLNCVNVKNLMGFYGNCMILPFTFPQRLAKKLGKTAADIQQSLYRYHTNNFRVPTTTISLPTQGMIGEAVLGETNVSEEIDITRFWNWQDSPIDNMTLDSNYFDSTDYLKDKQAPSISSLNLQGASAPTAVQVPDLINKLVSKQTPQFTDLTGLKELKEILNKGTESASAGRDKVIENSNDIAKAAMKALIEKAKIDNKIATDNENDNTEGGEKPGGDGKPGGNGKPNGDGKPGGDGKPNGDGKPGGNGKPNGDGKPGKGDSDGDGDDESGPGGSGAPPGNDGTAPPAGGGSTPPVDDATPPTGDNDDTPPIIPRQPDLSDGEGGEQNESAQPPAFISRVNSMAEAICTSAKTLALFNGEYGYDEEALPYVTHEGGPRGAEYYAAAIKYDGKDIYFLTVNPYLDSDKQWEGHKDSRGQFYLCRSTNMLGNRMDNGPQVGESYLNKILEVLGNSNEPANLYRFAWKCNIFVGDAMLLACYNYALQHNREMTMDDLNRKFVKFGLMRNVANKETNPKGFIPRYMNASNWPSTLKPANGLTEAIESFDQRGNIKPGAIAAFFTNNNGAPDHAEHLEIVTEIKMVSDEEFEMRSIGSHWNGAYVGLYSLKNVDNRIQEVNKHDRFIVFYNINEQFFEAIINS